MLLAQLVGPPQSADSGAVKRERRQRGLIDPKQPLRQPPFFQRQRIQLNKLFRDLRDFGQRRESDP